MKGKPVIIFNRKDEETGINFWDKLITMLQPLCGEDLFEVVDELEAIVPTLDRLI